MVDKKQMTRIKILMILLMLCMMDCNNNKVSNTNENTKSIPSWNLKPNHIYYFSNVYYSRTDTTVLNVPDSVWKKILPDSVFEVAFNKITEEAFKGMYWNYTGIGTYYCAICGNALFRSDSKFASSCGWPSFFETLRRNSVEYTQDTSYEMIRTEVLCSRCGAHLGHLFDDGPPPTGKRFCMNSIVLDFEPDNQAKEKLD